MQPRLPKWVHDAAAICGVLGTGVLSLLQLVHPFAMGVVAGIAVAYLVIHRRLRLGQTTCGYHQIKALCHHVLNHVKNDVWIFAGDMSWIPRDIEVMRALRRKANIFILATTPQTNDDQENLKLARSVATDVRHYPLDVKTLRALILEPKSREHASIVAIWKKPRPSTKILFRDPKNPNALVSYTAVIVSSDEEPLLFDALTGLFRQYWGDDPRLNP